MGGLGPGIGGAELIVIGLVALLVVGPKDLPLLMRRVGQFVAKARGMANEFRSSFDEMARQSELDDLRKEVEALRLGQGLTPLGPDAENTFRDIQAGLNQPLLPADTAQPVAPYVAPEPEPVMTGVSEWPDAAPPAKPARKPRATSKPKAAASTTKTRATPAKADAEASPAKAAPKRRAAPATAAAEAKPARKPRTRKPVT